MRTVVFLLSFWLFLVAHAVAWNAPLLAAALLLRRRIRRVAIAAALSVGFCAATSWWLWKMEWFDIWRHGFPPVSYLIRVYVPWLLAVGSVGWFIGWRISTRRVPSLA